MRVGMGAFAFVASRPWLYRLATASAVRAMRLLSRGGWIRRLPFGGAWTEHRDFPAPAARTFMQMYGSKNQGRAKGAA